MQHQQPRAAELGRRLVAGAARRDWVWGVANHCDRLEGARPRAGRDPRAEGDALGAAAWARGSKLEVSADEGAADAAAQRGVDLEARVESVRLLLSRLSLRKERGVRGLGRRRNLGFGC